MSEKAASNTFTKSEIPSPEKHSLGEIVPEASPRKYFLQDFSSVKISSMRTRDLVARMEFTFGTNFISREIPRLLTKYSKFSAVVLGPIGLPPVGVNNTESGAPAVRDFSLM